LHDPVVEKYSAAAEPGHAAPVIGPGYMFTQLEFGHHTRTSGEET
jgi:hypothetical protein